MDNLQRQTIHFQQIYFQSYQTIFTKKTHYVLLKNFKLLQNQMKTTDLTKFTMTVYQIKVFNRMCKY